MVSVLKQQSPQTTHKGFLVGTPAYNDHIQQIALALHEADMLGMYSFTGVDSFNSVPARLVRRLVKELAPPLHRKLLRRKIKVLPAALVESDWTWDFFRFQDSAPSQRFPGFPVTRFGGEFRMVIQQIDIIQLGLSGTGPGRNHLPGFFFNLHSLILRDVSSGRKHIHRAAEQPARQKRESGAHGRQEHCPPFKGQKDPWTQQVENGMDPPR